MHPARALERLGGVARTARLLEWTSKDRLAAAADRGEVVRLTRGTYALPEAHGGMVAASRLSGVVSHASAALLHGWEVAYQPERPAVIIPRGRKVRVPIRGVEVRHRDLDDHETADGRTSPHRTVIDCAKDLPFPQALSIADSALRHDAVDQGHLLRLANQVPTNGRRQAIRVATEATSKAANPFESVLRAIALDVPDLSVVPQFEIEDADIYIRPDLVDAERRLVLEAESFEYHGGRKALSRDCVRYNTLTLMGWTVLRFPWEHVMFEPEYVRAVLMAAVGHTTSRHSWARSA